MRGALMNPLPQRGRGWQPGPGGKASRALDIRIHVRFGAGAGVRHGALLGVADGLHVYPQRARLVAVFARGPGATSIVPTTASIVTLSRSRNSAIGPPTAASGPTWPMQNPCVAPENLPSVKSATRS